MACVIDRGQIPALTYTTWPYFTFDADGTTIYFTDGATLESFGYPVFAAGSTYRTAEAGYSVESLGMLPSGDLIWWETNWTGTWKLRTGPSGTLVLTAPAGYNQWVLVVSPYDGEVYTVSEETGADGDLHLWRVDGGSLTSVHPTPAQDLDSDFDVIGLAATADGGIWVGGGNGQVGRFDIPTGFVHTSPDNDDPGGGVYPDGASSLALMPRPDGTVWVVAQGGAGKVLTWTGTAIVIADQDCVDGYVGGASGWTADLSVVAFWDGNDDHLWEIGVPSRFWLGKVGFRG
jgi:hypothetical protein